MIAIWFTAAPQSRNGMVHFFEMFCKAMKTSFMADSVDGKDWRFRVTLLIE